MFTGITTDICQRAWFVVLPSVVYAAESGVTNKLAGAIVVFDPRIPNNQQARAEDLILFAKTINTPEQDLEYLETATSMAYASFKTGLPSSRVQQEPTYHEGDTKQSGSTVDPYGLIVAFSSDQAEYDEMFAEILASVIKAMCRNGMTGTGGVMNQDSPYIGR